MASSVKNRGYINHSNTLAYGIKGNNEVVKMNTDVIKFHNNVGFFAAAFVFKFKNKTPSHYSAQIITKLKRLPCIMLNVGVDIQGR